MPQDPVTLWLFAGAAMIVFEAVTAPGLGIFLAGLGALTTAIVIKLGVVEEAHTAAQFAWFFGLTTVWTSLLWKQFKKFRLSMGHKGKSGQLEIKDIVGSTAVVGRGGLKRGEIGQALWSGTVMNATLDEKSPETFVAEGMHVQINSVSGTTLAVSLIHHKEA